MGRTTISPLHYTNSDTESGLRGFGRSAANITQIGTNPLFRFATTLFDLIGPTSIPSHGYQFRIDGNVYRNTEGTVGPTIRGGLWPWSSHWGLLEGNIHYNCGGAGLFIDGWSSKNVVKSNFAVKIKRVAGVTRPGDRRAADGLDLGCEGVGLWLRTTDNYVGFKPGDTEFERNFSADCLYGAI